MQIKISWLLKKPTDLDLHCLQRQGISRVSRTRVKDKIEVSSGKLGSLNWVTLNIHFCLACANSVDPAQRPQNVAFFIPRAGSTMFAAHPAIFIHINRTLKFLRVNRVNEHI